VEITVEQSGHIWRYNTAHAHCMVDNATNTHAEYVILYLDCCSTATVVTRTRLNVNLYESCLSCYMWIEGTESGYAWLLFHLHAPEVLITYIIHDNRRRLHCYVSSCHGKLCTLFMLQMIPRCYHAHLNRSLQLCPPNVTDTTCGVLCSGPYFWRRCQMAFVPRTLVNPLTPN